MRTPAPIPRAAALTRSAETQLAGRDLPAREAAEAGHHRQTKVCDVVPHSGVGATPTTSEPTSLLPALLTSQFLRDRLHGCVGTPPPLDESVPLARVSPPHDD